MGYGKNPKSGSGSTSAAKRKDAKVPFSESRFVRIELTEKDKEQFRALLEAGEFESLRIDDFLSERYSVSFSEGDGGKTVVCTVRMAYVDHPNAGLSLTGRGRDSATALAVCAYKHTYLCSEQLWRAAEDSRGGSYSDIA